MVFENEKAGIIIEDYICQNISFFQFMNEAIRYYDGNDKVFCISGFMRWQIRFTNKSTYLSRFHNNTGWACYQGQRIVYLRFLRTNSSKLDKQLFRVEGQIEGEFLL